LARTLLGRPTPYAATPFVWSDQGDLSVRYVGHCPAPDEIVTHVEGPDSAAVTYAVNGDVHAACTVNLDGHAARAQQLLRRGPVRVDDWQW
jgi:hypothetical protein